MVYQELVYQNEPLKTMLTGSNTLSLPSPHAVFAQLSRSAFSTILESGTGEEALKFTPQAQYPNALICIAR